MTTARLDAGSAALTTTAFSPAATTMHTTSTRRPTRGQRDGLFSAAHRVGSTACCIAAVVALTGLASAARAADTAPSETPSPRAATNPLAAAQAQIKAKNWSAAISELRRADLPGNADWNNLMGYAQRKQTPPDLVAAQRYYDNALRIQPQHQGALEYAGELALMKGDLATAEKHLATLSRLCSSPCEPLDDLKAAVAKHKAGGKP